MSLALARELAALPAVSVSDALGIEHDAFFNALDSEETKRIMQRFRPKGGLGNETRKCGED